VIIFILFVKNAEIEKQKRTIINFVHIADKTYQLLHFIF